MCLFKPKFKSYQIAAEDIVVYKVLNSDMRSTYQLFQYELNRLYKKSWDEDFILYCNRCDCLGGNMFHSCSDPTYCNYLYKTQDSYQLYKCIIPKGSKYYTGIVTLTTDKQFYKEFGSNQIIIKEICH